MNQLSQLHLEGFRSIKEADIEFRPLNVMIGANGAGKSNLIDFFRMLNYAMSRGFQKNYIPDRGPASHILHFGPDRTPVVHAELDFRTEVGNNFYRFTMARVKQDDTFIFTEEEVQYHADVYERPTPPIPLGPGGHRESGLAEPWTQNDATVRFIKRLIGGCRVYQFHDTGVESFLRGKPFLDDNRYLRADGGNVPAVLFRLKEQYPDYHADILRNLQAVLPWLDDLVLEPEGPPDKRIIALRWRAAGHPEYDFVAGQLSDGSLRIIALVTLLLLPDELLPDLLIIDEPELGLHPAAEQVIAGLIKYASRRRQVIVSTQSSTFIDHFSADDIIVVENEDGKSTFTRQSSEALGKWLERYTLSQIWSKNLIGGRP
jgi:predicted ATPase